MLGKLNYDAARKDKHESKTIKVAVRTVSSAAITFIVNSKLLLGNFIAFQKASK